MISELRRIVEDSEIMREDDAKWPKKNVVGRQELEIRLGNEHISFEVRTGLRLVSWPLLFERASSLDLLSHLFWLYTDR